MTTNNPKVSGYIPQEIFDHLLEFKEERSLKSVSLALTVVLSEYFQVDQKVDRQSSLLSGSDFASREQLEDLEKKISELSSSLLSELDRVADEKISRLRDELLYSPLKIAGKEVVILQDESLSELPSEPEKDRNHLQLNFIDSIPEKEGLKEESLISESVPNPPDSIRSENPNMLSGQELAKRLNITTSTLSTKKKELKEQDFYDWLKDKDPDNISWKPIDGDLKVRVKGWIPSDDTPSELLSRLHEWVSIAS